MTLTETRLECAEIAPLQAELDDIDAAANLYHKIPYAGVFDKLTVITSTKLMWIALPQTRRLLGRVGKVTPEAVSSELTAASRREVRPCESPSLEPAPAPAATSGSRLGEALV